MKIPDKIANEMLILTA